MKLRKSFYRALREAAGAFKWKVKYGEIRGVRGNRTYCPLTAVYYYRTGKFIEIDYATDTELLDYNNMYLITESSDCESNMLLPKTERVCRKALARAVGLAVE